MSDTMTPCKHCNGVGWHMAWCPDGPGPSPKKLPGIGFGRELSAQEKAREAELAAANAAKEMQHGQVLE